MALEAILAEKPGDSGSDQEAVAQLAELIYLAGRSHELLGQLKQASQYYLQVDQLCAGYRDSRERLADLARGIAARSVRGSDRGD